MSISLKSTIACNLGCKYCYENDIRNAGNAKSAFSYNKDEMTKTLIKQLITNDPGKQGLILHGGEPLLMPINDLEHFLKISYEIAGKSCIQTNGELITDEIIELLKKYNCGIGISIDGLGELNIGRWKYSKEATLEYTKKVWEIIKKLKVNDIDVGIIIVVSRTNGLREQREEFKKFLLDLKELGVRGGRLNPVNVDTKYKEEFELTPSELADFWSDMVEFTTKHGLSYSPIRDVTDALMNLSLQSCIFTKCDPFYTTAEQGVQSDGTMGNCLMPAKEGIIYLQDEFGESFERYDILKNIPAEQGGCGGCRYWNICTGICPAEGIDDDGQYDFRGKSRWCEGYYALYEAVENNLRNTMPSIILQTDINSGVGYDDFIVAPEVTYERITKLLRTRDDWPDYKVDIEQKLEDGKAHLMRNYLGHFEAALINNEIEKNKTEVVQNQPTKVENMEIQLGSDLLQKLRNGEFTTIPVREGDTK